MRLLTFALVVLVRGATVNEYPSGTIRITVRLFRWRRGRHSRPARFGSAGTDAKSDGSGRKSLKSDRLLHTGRSELFYYVN
jgi:hypothetical protein